MPTTTQRNVRVPDELWARAQAKARSEYTTVSAVLVRLLNDWVNDGNPDDNPEVTD